MQRLCLGRAYPLMISPVLQFYSTKTGKTDHTLPSKLLCNDCHSPLGDEGRRMVSHPCFAC